MLHELQYKKTQVHEDRELNNLIKILMKESADRTSTQVAVINDFIKKVDWFEEQKITGPDLMDLA